MIKIMFVCHGNICRSPMAEFVMKQLVASREMADHFQIVSKATSTDAIGLPVYSGTHNELQKHGISCHGKVACQLRKEDYEQHDLFIGMDKYNCKNMMIIFGKDPQKKVKQLLDTDVTDPWYTGDFEAAYNDIMQGCGLLLKSLLEGRS